ncbi:hypothetical protein Glove_750g39 [Diversispora epigaea]|uniref:BTB domain-containing protein n=1 Tax=Diversispora epigaea TaxID=1348612 RepID=A0A397G2X5_9GLOM|nr:hypothetical protein Glove_750g39 [Diversispora epigaea]
MTFKFLDKLFQDFSELLLNDKEYNVIIENKKTFTAHSAVLQLEFGELSAKLENYLIESKASCIILKSVEFTTLYESALVSILKRDDLQMKESEILVLTEELSTRVNQSFSTITRKREPLTDHVNTQSASRNEEHAAWIDNRTTKLSTRVNQSFSTITRKREPLTDHVNTQSASRK